MQKRDPRRQKFWYSFLWFVATMLVLIGLLQFLRNPVILMALWAVGIVWGGILAYKVSQLLFGTNQFVASAARSRVYLEEARDYQTKIANVLKSASGSASHVDPRQIIGQIDSLAVAVEDLVARIDSLEHNDVIRRDLRAVPQAIKDLEARLASESDPTIRTQLEHTLANRQKQLASLAALQSTIKRAEIQIESTLSQLGTIYSQLLTGQSTSQVADYGRLATDVDEEVRLLQDHLEALREVKLGEA